MQYLRAFALIFMVMVSGCQENLDNLMVNSGSIEANIDSIGSFNREYNPNLQLVILLEPDYGKAVCREIDPSLREENFETWPYGTHSDTVFRSVYERYKDQPLENWPIICIPSANFEAINNLLTNDSRYDKLPVVMPYIKTGSWYTNTLNFSSSKVFKQVLVGAGDNHRNDWTRGNKLDFIDSVKIQYVNPDPQYGYVITNIENIPGYTRVWTSLAAHASSGTQVWLNVVGSSATIYNRFCVLSRGNDYIDIYRIDIGQFQSGFGKSNYLSGAVFSVAAKLNGLMRCSKKSFQKVVKDAKASASNNGIKNDSTGYGYINYIPDITGSR